MEAQVPEVDRIAITATATFALAFGTLALLQRKGLVSAAEIKETTEYATHGLEGMGLPAGVTQGARAMLQELMSFFESRELEA